MSKLFAIDTNVAVYAFVDDTKAEKSRDLLDAGPCISVQLLNEFVNVASRKLGKPWSEIENGLAMIISVAISVRPLDMAVHNLALATARKYKLTIYDSLMVAAAWLDRCEIFYSEDMQHGLVINERLRILNPYILDK